MHIRPAEPADLPAINAIYNDAVFTTEATMDTEPRGNETAEAWFRHHGGAYPLLVAELDGAIAGWGSLSRWSERCGYAGTTELSVYVKAGLRGKGIGKKLMAALIDHARQSGHHSIISRITSGNSVSIRLHETFGFKEVGVLREAGFKFGRWLDVAIYQLLL